MHPRHFADVQPNRTAAHFPAANVTLSYDALESAANRGARQLLELGLRRGDAIALLIENEAAFFEVYWAAQRIGLYITPLSTRLQASEIAFILGDSAARVLVSSFSLTTRAREACSMLGEGAPDLFCVGEGGALADSWEASLSAFPDTPAHDESSGRAMVYSSGTTGRPKGVKMPLPDFRIDQPDPAAVAFGRRYDLGEDTVYLSPAPLYHTAPLFYCTSVQRLGGSVIVLDKFDPEAFLEAIEQYRVTFTQVVPTMLVRLMKLPEQTRRRYDLSSLRQLVHAAAPCPVAVKQAVIDWLGPIVSEYYGGSEAFGSTFITAREWLKRPGSVGTSQRGAIHICDEEGVVLPPGETGLIYFESSAAFEYHNDSQKTADARHPSEPWWTLGDIGYLDKDGYLYLTDRRSFTIVSGGVNIYPREIEDVLIQHSSVADVAVIGVPNEEFGQEVKAVVQPVEGCTLGAVLANELIAFCRDRLAAFKCPRSVDFDPNLPRQPNGKLYKRVVQDRYWPQGASRIVLSPLL